MVIKHEIRLDIILQKAKKKHILPEYEVDKAIRFSASHLLISRVFVINFPPARWVFRCHSSPSVVVGKAKHYADGKIRGWKKNAHTRMCIGKIHVILGFSFFFVFQPEAINSSANYANGWCRAMKLCFIVIEK